MEAKETTHVTTLAVVAAHRVDPWDTVLFQELPARGIAPTILGEADDGSQVPRRNVTTLRQFNIVRRVASLERLGFTVHGLAADHRLRFVPTPFGLDDAIPGLGKMLRPYDVVMALEIYRASSYQSCLHHPRVIVKVTENLANNPPHWPFSWFRRRVARLAKRFVCVSQGAQEALRAEGVDASKIAIIPEPVDTTVFSPSNQPNRSDRFTIGFAGYLDDRHGVLDLLNAFEGLAPDSAAHLKIAGSGPLAPKVLARVRQPGLDGRVDVVGTLRHDQMPAFLNGIDVLCVPYRTVPGWKPQFGIVNIEAMAVGKPVVSTRSGAVPEVVPPELDRFLVGEGDVSALTNALQRLAGEPAVRENLGRIARDWTVRKFDVGHVADQWAALVAQVVDGSETS